MNARQYTQSHEDRVNLVIHVLAVPLFWLSSLSALVFLAMGAWSYLAWSAAGLGASLGLQAIGHKREALQPEPFDGPFDFLTRIFVEQFYRFPALVLCGGWWRNFREKPKG